MRTFILSMVELAAILACTPAQADDVYRWVDANGVTNYSSTPPAKMAAGSKLDVVAPRVSVYTPEAAAQGAAIGANPQADRVRDNRIQRLEQALDADRQARQHAAAADARAAQAAHDQCAAQGYADCDAYGVYLPYPPLVTGVARRSSQFAVPATVPSVPLTGVTAGDMTNAIGAAGGAINRTPGAAGSGMTTLRGDLPAQTTKRSAPK